MRTISLVPVGTVGAFAGLAALHVAWGRGSSFPFAEPAELADAVIGRPATLVPPPAACFAVAGLLGAAALVVGGAGLLPQRAQRRASAVLALVLAVRGALGLAGRTDLASPGSSSPRFRRNDRRLFAPLCLALCAGTILSAKRSR